MKPPKKIRRRRKRHQSSPWERRASMILELPERPGEAREARRQRAHLAALEVLASRRADVEPTHVLAVLAMESGRWRVVPIPRDTKLPASIVRVIARADVGRERHGLDVNEVVVVVVVDESEANWYLGRRKWVPLTAGGAA